MAVIQFHPETAEASVPRRLLLQDFFAATTAIDGDDPANADHRTWLELVAPYAVQDAISNYDGVMASNVWGALRRGELAEGGFLTVPTLRDAAIRAALVAALVEVLGGAS